MALDNRLVVYNEQGEPVDYDILASDVKFLPDGKDLPTKLAELEGEIGQGGYAPPQGGIPKSDLAQSVQDSLDKADSALQDEDVAEVAKTGSYNDLENKPTIPDTSGLATKTELNAKQDKLSAGNGIVIANDGKTVSVAEAIRTGAAAGATAVQPSDLQQALADKATITGITTNQDGTFTIALSNGDSYTINLNHTHENMAKIVKCTEATLPQTLDNDTIYVQVDNATNPTEIESIYLFGLEFTGGGLPTGVPQISKPTPNSTINLGTAYGQGGSTGTVKIKGRSLTANSTVVVSVSSGFSLSYGQQSGSSINIDAADVILGCDVTVYATAYGTSGTILITSHTDSLSVEANLTSDVVEDLTGVKLTGTQWMQTDYYPNPNTEFELSCKFIENSLSRDTSSPYNQYFIDCVQTDAERFSVYNGSHDASTPYGSFVVVINNDTNRFNNDPQLLVFDASEEAKAAFLTDMLIKYQKGVNRMDTSADTATFSAEVKHLPLKGTTMSNALMIGRSRNGGIYNCFDLVIYELKIKENGSIVHDWVPKLKNGSTPGLYDTVTDTFISSETSTELVAVPLT